MCLPTATPITGRQIPDVFDNLGADASPEQQALADQISQVWLNFAKTGTPSAENMPEWEPYTREGGATMLLDTQPRLAYHHDQALLKILAPDYVY